MTVTMAIILGLIIAFIIIYIALNPQVLKPKKRSEHQDLIDRIQDRIAKANGASIEQFSLENQSEQQKTTVDFYKDAEFINKNCTNLDDFIINEDMNRYDLRKLADLNGIQLQISQAWYPLVIDLIKELNTLGWDRRVSCIKEKYASLRFYTDCKYNDSIYTLLEQYEHKSEHVCETCGEKGEIRHNSGWDYVACRKHYIENRGEIEVLTSGFRHNGTDYHWKDVQDVYFEDKDYYEKYRFLKIEFKKANVKHQGWTDNRLFISKSSIGFGNFLNHIPDNFSRLDYDYIRNFKNVEYCEICGYQAVYFGECECCEKDTWTEYIKKWNGPNDDHEKQSHIKYRQISWTEDNGETCEVLEKNYSKNPDYKIVFTEEEKRKYLEYQEEEEADED